MYSKGSSTVANLTLQMPNTCREVSFSCYLNKSEETMIRELAKSKNDEEIGVFGAEKYFKGEIEDGSNNNDLRFVDAKNMDEKFKEFDHGFPGNLRVDQTNMHTHDTPSVRSSVSCNSRNGLLPHTKQTPGKVENGSKTMKFLPRFGCNCLNKKSTQINEKRYIHTKENSKPDHISVRIPEDSNQKPDQFSVRILEDSNQKPDQFSIRISDSDQKTGQVLSKFAQAKARTDHFSFPVMNSNDPNSNSSSNSKSSSKSGNLAGKVQGDNNNDGLSLGKKLSLLNEWKHEMYLPSRGTYNNNGDGDGDSDSSSDLFEIESFSPTGDSSFSAHRKSKFNSYAPSEVSIDWSVVTASAADFSVASDYEGVRTGGGRRRNSGRNDQVRGKKDEQKKRSGILSGCTSHKAVRVA